MLFNTSEIAVSGCFNGPAGFKIEMATHRMPIQPFRKINESGHDYNWYPKVSKSL